ncbi:polygalacturonase At1g48100-like [Henckelia pumila]|uniref:polygalacturonase At1g48100-like n=1 Tax=Henckelia pumila TaxID=405737 RepID=UPI003C6E17EE
MGKYIHIYGSLSLCFALFFNLLCRTVLCYSGGADLFSQMRPFFIANRGRGHTRGGILDSSNIFNVLNFGARGDGSSYENEAFEAAWAATCKADGGVMVVPSGYTFLLRPIIFSGGKCQSNVVVQVDGEIVAPPNKSDWEENASQWILFVECKNGLTIRGNGGVFDGRGQAWWNPNKDYMYGHKHKLVAPLDQAWWDRNGDYMYGRKHKLVAPHEAWWNRNGDYIYGHKHKLAAGFAPNAMTISNSFNVTVTGITIQNSPRMHIDIEYCQQVKVFNFTVSSPGDSRNTDGIHLSRSQHVDIHNSTLACGDDCVSIQTGCSDIEIYDVNCGPGHGYSIGGLGYHKQQAQVSDIIIRDSSVRDSMTGVRIKTWEGGSGLVQNVTFSNIMMSDVKIPITIDQHYCGGAKGCGNEGSAVAITGITYQNITGTYTKTSVSLMCSDQEPCKDLKVADIRLTPSGYKKKGSGKGPYCSNAYGEVLTQTLPPLNDCLQVDSLAY